MSHSGMGENPRLPGEDFSKPILRGEIALRLRELIREICASHDVQIVKGHVRPDHVHLMAN